MGVHSSTLSSSGSDDGSEPPDDADDLDCQHRRNSGRRHHRTKMSEEMLDAMDKVVLLSMLVKGHTPQLIAAEQER